MRGLIQGRATSIKRGRGEKLFRARRGRRGDTAGLVLHAHARALGACIPCCPLLPWILHLAADPSPDIHTTLQIGCLAPAAIAPPTIAAATAVAHRAVPKSAVGPVAVVVWSRTGRGAFARRVSIASLGSGWPGPRRVIASRGSSWPEPLVRRSGSNVTRCVCWRRFALRRCWILRVGDIKLT